MIMTDQDHDGSHIKGLLINFIQHLWPSLLKRRGILVEFITHIVVCKAGWKGTFHRFHKWHTFFWPNSLIQSWWIFPFRMLFRKGKTYKKLKKRQLDFCKLKIMRKHAINFFCKLEMIKSMDLSYFCCCKFKTLKTDEFNFLKTEKALKTWI